jgi:hypothetical protein
MQLFCPVCQSAFAGTQRCPRCGGLLLLPQESAEAALPREAGEPAAKAAPPPAARVAVGAVLALGVYMGLRKLAGGAAAALAARSEPEAWWSSLEGLSAVYGAQVAAVVFGSVVAAAGRAGGLAFGSAVGGLCGAMFLAAELFAGAPPQDLVLYVQPLVLACAGACAGVFAARVWGAVPELHLPVTDRSRLSSSRFAVLKEDEPARPTSWVRVLLGAALMVLAVVAADKVRNGAQKYSGGMLRVNSVGQARFLTWQLAVLGGLAGGAVAGASTGAGLRHGALAGGASAAGVVALTAALGEPLSPVAYWLGQLSLAGLPPTDPAALVAAAAGMLILGVVGGWLGGTLFLPLAPAHMRGRLGSGLD